MLFRIIQVSLAQPPRCPGEGRPRPGEREEQRAQGPSARSSAAGPASRALVRGQGSFHPTSCRTLQRLPADTGPRAHWVGLGTIFTGSMLHSWSRPSKSRPRSVGSSSALPLCTQQSGTCHFFVPQFLACKGGLRTANLDEIIHGRDSVSSKVLPTCQSSLK